MINQKNERISFNDRHFIIEISLLLYKAQRKIIISLFISDNIKVKELKEFISKDFDFPINTMSFFNPLTGILDDSFEFQFEQDKKINLNLILNAPKQNNFNLNYQNNMKNQNIQKNINEYEIIKKSESKNKDFQKLNNSNHQLHNFINEEKKICIDIDTNLNNNINNSNNNKNQFNNNTDNKKVDGIVINKIKNANFNYFLTKKFENKMDNNYSLLKKKRLSNLHQENKLKEDNLSNKEKNTKKIKIINFNVNKTVDQNNIKILNKEKDS